MLVCSCTTSIPRMQAYVYCVSVCLLVIVLRIYQACMLSVLFYGAECWKSLKIEAPSQTEYFQSWVL